MKVDKDFTVKFGEYTFRADEIKTINISDGWFSMEKLPKDGMITKLETKLENVEFLTASTVTPLQMIRQEFMEINECNNETIYPSHPMHKGLNEVIKKIKKDPATEVSDIWCGKLYVGNSKAKVSDDAAVKAMKDAADAIGKAAEAICKATEQIKVDFSIDGKKLSKLINDYGKPITRSGG